MRRVVRTGFVAGISGAALLLAGVVTPLGSVRVAEAHGTRGNNIILQEGRGRNIGCVNARSNPLGWYRIYKVYESPYRFADGRWHIDPGERYYWNSQGQIVGRFLWQFSKCGT